MSAQDLRTRLLAECQEAVASGEVDESDVVPTLASVASTVKRDDWPPEVLEA